MEKLFENFTVTISKLNKLVQRIKLYEMENYGLNAVHVMCIYYLNERGKATSRELVKLTLEDKAAISRALKLLKEKELINYSIGKYNTPATLTEKGLEVAKFINERADCAVKATGSFMTEEQRSAFYDTLGKLCKNLENYYLSLKKD